MATFSKIDGAEPSTVTFQLATVTQDRGGAVQHQEIVTLGGSESTLAIAQVRATAPASTEFGLVVRVAEPSTGPFAISSIAGPVTMRSSKADALVTVYQSSAADLNVTVAGYVAPSTTVTVSTGSIRVHQSSAADLNVTVAGYSTIAAVSSLAGRVTTMPLSTLWGSCGGFHFDSSGGLQVNVVGGSAASTTVNVSSVAGIVSVAGNQSSNSSVYLPVRLTNGTSFLSAGADYADGSTASGITGPTLLYDNGSNVTMRPVSLTLGLPVNVVGGTISASTTVNVSSLAGAVIVRSSAANALVSVYQSTAADLNVTVAGYVAPSTIVSVSTLQGRVAIAGFHAVSGIVNVTDSTNNAINVNVVAGAAGGSTIMTVSTVQGVVRIAGNNAADGIVHVGDSTNAALRVNVVAGSAASTTVNVSSLAGAVITRSSKADMLVTAYQSSAADFNVTVAGYSTTINISSLAGPVICRSSKADFLATVYQSSAADLQVTASQNSTATWSVLSRTTTSSGGGVEGSTGTPAAGVTGLHVRQVYPTLNSTTIVITSTHSTAIYPLISSVAGLRHKVYAYFIGSTHTNPSTLIFCSSASGAGFDHWHVNFGSGSSGMTGANLALNPPGFIFAGIAQNALNVKIEGGGSSVTSTVVARISLAWFDEA